MSISYTVKINENGMSTYRENRENRENKKGSNLMLLPTWLLCPFHHYFLNAAVQFCSVARYRFAA